MNPVAFIQALLIALSLAIDVFAVSIGLGIRYTRPAVRLRFAVVFVGAELTMAFIGSLVGDVLFRIFGEIIGYVGFLALVLIGIFIIVETQKTQKQPMDLSTGLGLILSAVGVSCDSLGIGFSIRSIHIPFRMMMTAIAVCTILATIIGFTLGRRLGQHFEERAECAAGILLIATGVFFSVLKATGYG